MGFMRRFVYKGRYWEVSANHGETHIIPFDVCNNRDGLADYVEGTVDRDDNDTIVAELKMGYYGRYSAPGYMDCTDWVAGETLAIVNEQLDAYDDDTEDDDSDTNETEE